MTFGHPGFVNPPSHGRLTRCKLTPRGTPASRPRNVRSAGRPASQPDPIVSRSRPPLRTLLPLTVCLAAVAPAHALEPAPDGVRDFLDATCADCHTGDYAEGGFDLASLPDEPTFADAGRWDRVHDRVRDGEMPPEEYGEPDAADRTRFLSGVDRWLTAAQAADAADLGRSRGRRLTAVQLERSLHGALGIDVPLTHLLPPDRKSHGFTTVTDGGLSHHDLAAHLEVVDAALDEAFRRATTPDDTWEKTLSAEDLCRKDPKKRCREPEFFRGKAVVWSAGLEFYGRLPATTARGEGMWLRFTFEASSLKAPPRGVWCTVRTGAGVSSEPALTDLTAFLATPEPTTVGVTAWVPAGHLFEVRPSDGRLKRGNTPGGQVGAGEMQKQDVAGVGLHGATLARVHLGPDDDGVRALLFGDVAVEEVTREGEPDSFEPRPADPAAALGALLQGFADRAFRRPADPADVAPHAAAARERLDAGATFSEALRGGYRSLLCSPRFLYHVEPPGELDGPALASRLSYFLTGGPPDAELAEAGASGALLEPAALRAQTDRLLNDAGTEAFARDFAREWLDLNELDATEVSSLYPNFDAALKVSMRDQTRGLLAAMLRDDLSVTHVVDADFELLNERLADHYGLPFDRDPAEWSQEDALVRTPLPAGSPRGGLLTQGALLKLTADGANTSPVLRGVWAGEKLLGVSVPPPPESVPAIEPDTRGATTIREQLAKHRADPSCASCHRKIDPVGFALESFDPAGAFRTDYTRWRKRKIVPRAPVDPSYALPDGRAFADAAEFQALIAADPAALAENLARHLLTYATGVPPAYADRPAVAAIAGRSAAGGYGVRTLLHETIQSDPFRRK